MNPGFQRLAGVSVRAPCRPEAGPGAAGAARRTSRCRSASRSTRRQPSCSTRCARIWRNWAVIRPRAACPNCATPRPRWAGAPLRAAGRQRGWRYAGAAGHRHARGAVRLRAGSGGCAQRRAAAAGADAQPLLPDLRRRGAAGRRRAVLPRTPLPPTASCPTWMPCRRKSGNAASCCSCAARPIRWAA